MTLIKEGETREERTARLAAEHREQVDNTVLSVRHVLTAEPKSEEEWERELQIHPLPEHVQQGVREFAESVRGKTGATSTLITLLEAATRPSQR